MRLKLRDSQDGAGAAASSVSTGADIAIVGRACRLPGAPSLDSFWSLLSSGRCAVTSIPPERWALERMYHPRGERGRTYTWAAGVLDDIWAFDPGAFGLSPREAEQMDPQQRLLLELATEALEDALIPPSAIAGSDAGVFIGASALDHGNLRIIDMSSADAYMMTGNTLSIVSNRLSYIFDLHGPSFTVDTACSSALVALNEAMVSLRSGRIDTAIVGGVNILASPYSFIGFSQASMLSKRGLCQAFAAQADGYVRAEGGVVLVLQTREAAERAGNPIRAILKASDVNSDGRTNGISLPSKTFQANLLRSLYRDAGIDLDRVAFVEAHGTGTPVGDPIEATAIGEVLAQGRRDPLLIGSVKTNIGHMEAASGLGGVLKAILALEHDCLPASLHSEELNPHIDFEGLNLKVAREATPLPRQEGLPRLAGVNSFGFGGTNAHVIVEDAPRVAAASVAAPPPFVMLSAHSRAALQALAADYAARLETMAPDEAATTLSAAIYKRDRLSHRLVVPYVSQASLVETLDRAFDEEQEYADAARATAPDRQAPVCFVFSGNGSQYAGMGLAAYARNPIFRERLDALSSAFHALAGWSIVEELHGADVMERLALTEISQPLLFAIQTAACHALRATGLEPAFVIGHSVGEVAAAAAAGILDEANALKTIHARSHHQELTAGSGAMAVLIAGRDVVDAIIAECPGLQIAAFNSPRAFTMSGSLSDIEELARLARPHKARVRKLDLNYPFHSSLMAPVQRPLLRSLASLEHRPSRLPFVSTVTGGILEGEAFDPHYWWRNVREPVLFTQAVTTARDAGARIFVEIGPSPVLLTHITDTFGERSAGIVTLPSLDKRDKGVDPITATVAQALARGAAVTEAKTFGPPPPAGAKVALPHYPWQRKSFQVTETSESHGLIRTADWHPLIGARYGNERLEWHSSLDTTMYPWLADHCVDGRAILPGAAFAEMALAVARDWLGTDEATVVDLEITSPMQLTPDTAREVLCRLSPIANHLEILSRPRLGQTPWQTHATAKILRDPRIGQLPEVDDHAPLTPSHMVTGAEIYAMADRAGLQYGPAFQKLANATTVRPDRIVLDLTREAADQAFGVDPARMDSCFHALVLIFSSLRDAVHGTAYIPVRFGEVVLRKPGATFVRARIDVLRRDERLIIANFLLLDADDQIVVFLREARFQAIRTSRGSNAVRQMVFQSTVLASEPTAGSKDRPLTLDRLRALVGTTDQSPSMAPDFILLEGWATAFALQTAQALSTANFIDLDALVSSGRLPAKARTWLETVMVSLDRSGLSHADRLGRHIDPDIELPDPDEILRTIAEEYQNLSAELLVAASTVTTAGAIVGGHGDALGRPLTPKVLDGFELGSSRIVAQAAYLLDLVARSAWDWPRDRAMRILQVGYGPLTAGLAALAGRLEARLTVYDPDRRRLERARMSLAESGDVTFVDKAEDLPPDGHDLVLAADSLHRHRRRPGFWAGLRRSMAPGAVFAAVEPIPSFFRDLVLGLDAAFADDASDFDGLSVTEGDWLEIMQSIGLGSPDVCTVATPDGNAALLLLGQVEAERRSREASGTAIVLGDQDGDDAAEIVSGFATMLASAKLHVSIVLDRDLAPDDLVDPPAMIVVFADDHEDLNPAGRLEMRCMRLLRLAQTLEGLNTRLWIVTRGAIRTRQARGADIAAGLWAFSRTLANEVPSLDVRRVDVEDDVPNSLLAERLRDLVLAATDETEIVIGATATRVVRFEGGSDHHIGGATERADAARLKRGDGTGIDRLGWEAASRQAPGPNEVEIAVAAVGLNFRDVMFGLGLLPEEILEHGFAGPTLGLECAGVVERVGANVKTLSVGDRVMAFAKNAFSTHVTTPAAVAAPIADDLSFEKAATIPVAFLTAYHALMICARLKPGEWVLIHGGAGGVGLAAIQIARWRGARIIATAGTAERRALLEALGADHVFDSRSGAFVEDVRRVTETGVSVVVNSLAGEPMERSIGVLRPFGRFVELGKRDYVANTHIGLRPFRRNLSYFGVDLDQLLIDEPATSKLLLRSVIRLFARGELTPLPYRAFDADETIEAFRLMQQSGHIGKLVVRPPSRDGIFVRQRHSFTVSSDKVHVVTGGFGGFGLATARWLASKGARNIMLIGRSGAASQEARDALASLAASGVRVRAEALDVGDKAALQRIFARFGKELPPLAGVIHAAMVLDDAMLQNVTTERMARVLRPKVAGADHLDALTRSMKLDYFVLYSSATTLIGNPGQSVYVAANGYLEGMARRRRLAGLPALAIAWGAIEDVGVLARDTTTRDALATRLGMKGMPAADALRLMGLALANPSNDPADAVVAIAPVSWSAARNHLAVLKAPTYRRLSSHDVADTVEKDKVDIAALVAATSPEEARKTIGGLIVDEIARVLRLPKEDVPRSTPLAEIGLDSLMAVELALGLEERFVLNAPLSTTASSFTVSELADHVIGLATGSMSEDEAITRTMIERHLGPDAKAQIDDIDASAAMLHARSQTIKGLLD